VVSGDVMRGGIALSLGRKKTRSMAGLDLVDEEVWILPLRDYLLLATETALNQAEMIGGQSQ